MLLAPDDHANLSNIADTYVSLIYAFVNAPNTNAAATARTVMDAASEEAFAAGRALVLHQQAVDNTVVG